MRRSSPLCLVFIFHFISVNVLMSQIPGMKTYTQLDGFPGSVGYRVHQDSRGFMWIGTDNGVTCFDGRHFEVFDASDGLVDKDIFIALPDLDSTVMFIPLLNNYAYYRNGAVITAKQNPQLNTIQNKNLNRVFLDHATGVLWMGDVSVPRLYQLNGDRVTQHEIKNATNVFVPLRVFSNQLYYIGDPSDEEASNILRYDLQNETTLPIRMPSNGDPFIASHITSSLDANIFASVNHETGRVTVCRLKENGLKIEAEFQPQHPVDRTIIDQNDHLWLLLKEGGVTYAGKIGPSLGAKPGLTFLENTLVNDVLVDRDGHLWITTRFEGLHFLSATHWANALLTHPLHLPEEMPQRLIAYKNEGLLLSYYDQPMLSMISNGTSRKVYSNPDARDGYRCILETKQGLALASNYTFELLQEADGNWGQFYATDTAGSIKDLALDASDAPLISSNYGALRCLMSEGQRSGPTVLKMFYDGRTSCIETLTDGSVLIGTPNGIYYHKANGATELVDHALLSKANITDIATVADNAALLGTNSQGLFWFQPATGVIRHLLKPEDLESSQIAHIHVQEDSSYWLATDNGIFHVKLNAVDSLATVERYTFYDGLPSNNVSDLQVMNDTIYAATSAGLGIIPVHKSTTGASLPPITWIKSARTGNRVLHFPERLSMNYAGNEFVVSLSAISYESFNRIRYRYRLDNWSPRWAETEGSEISFSNLSPGSYTLNVQAINFAGIAGPMKSLQVQVLPSMWQTWWFRTLCALAGLILVSAALFLWTRRYRKRVELEAQRKKQLALLELEAIKAHINPHFISNCLNSIQYFHLKKDFERATEYFNLFSKLIHHTLEYSQETLIRLDHETRYLEDYLKLEKIRFKEGMTYSVEVDRALAPSLLIPAMLIQPYVENAIKHGISRNDGKGTVHVQFRSILNGGLEVIITDDGPGLHKATSNADHKPLGLRLSKTRAITYQELFDCIIEIAVEDRSDQSTPFNGTQVTIQIPILSDAETGT